MFPSYIFGACVGDTVMHCFPLNMDNEIIFGMEGVMKSYEEAIALWNFSGPTHFSQVIQKTISLARGLFILFYI